MSDFRNGYLSEYFLAVGTKRLAAVDVPKPSAKGTKSNQHELGDDGRRRFLRTVLGDEERSQKNQNPISTTFIWLNGEQEAVVCEGVSSFYDTRRKQPHRSAEWRLYYPDNDVTSLMNAGDRVYLAKLRKEDALLFLVVPDETGFTKDLDWLFGLSIQQELPLGESASQTLEAENDKSLDFVSRIVLDEIGIGYTDPNSNLIDNLVRQFDGKFPTTKVFSERARMALPHVCPRDDPDQALYDWLNLEEAMFRRIEHDQVAARLKQGFVDEGRADVDGFILFSLSIQNRRKSRMGKALENHLAALFESFDLKYSEQVITENGKKPDFIFPGRKEYYDSGFETDRLTVLAAKATCKERWTQILPEAARIEQKHLITLEPGLPESQTNQMAGSMVQLIVPSPLTKGFSKAQQEWLMQVSDFIELVSDRQKS